MTTLSYTTLGDTTFIGTSGFVLEPLSREIARDLTGHEFRQGEKGRGGRVEGGC